MTLFPLILAIAFAGFLVWIILQIPIPQIFKNIIMGLVIFALVIYVLQQLGVNTGIGPVRLK